MLRTHYEIPRYKQILPMLPCAIHCPKCRSEACLDEPFEFLKGNAAKVALSDPSRKGVKMGGGFMVEKYPNEFPWHASENLRAQARLYRNIPEVWGVCTCGTCGYRQKRRLHWPEEAYYKTEIRGEVLWAWTREQAEALRLHIAAKDRKLPRAARGGHFWFLRHIPKHFLEVKNRTEALKKLDRLLTVK